MYILSIYLFDLDVQFNIYLVSSSKNVDFFSVAASYWKMQAEDGTNATGSARWQS